MLLCAALWLLPALARAQGACALPFGPGEHLVYRIEYVGLTAGTVDITVGTVKGREGRQSVSVVATAETRSAFRIFPVHDKLVSELDVDALRTTGDVLDGHEGTRRWRQRMGFHHREGTLQIHRVHPDAPPEALTLPMAKGALDVAGLFLVARAQTFEPGASYTLPVTTDTHGFTLRGTVGAPESFDSEALGRRPVYRTELLAGFGGKLSTAKAMEVLYTRDPRHVPVWARAGFALGSITAVLVSYQPGAELSRACQASRAPDAGARGAAAAK